MRHLLTTLLALAALALPIERAHAGVVGETSEAFASKVTDDPTAQKEIGNAVETLSRLLPGAGEAAGELGGAPRGVRPARGISGPFEDLVVNFDKLACAAWIVSYRDWYLGLILKRDPETPPETLAAAQNLLNKVIFGCRKIIDPGTYEALAATPQPEAGPAAQPGGGSATQVDVIDGVLMITASDNICWNRCRDKWAAWKGARAMRQRAEDRLAAARLRADTLARNTIPALERELAGSERALAEMQARRPRYPRSDPRLDSSIAREDVNAANLRTQIERHRADLEALRREIRDLDASLAGLQQREDAARQVYLDCIRGCRDQARAAGDRSDFAEKTVEELSRVPSVGMLPTPVRPVDRRMDMRIGRPARYGMPSERADNPATAYANAAYGVLREALSEERGDDRQDETRETGRQDGMTGAMPAPARNFRDQFIRMRQDRPADGGYRY